MNDNSVQHCDQSKLSQVRRRAKLLGYGVQKRRSIRWEGTEFTPLYRLIDRDTGFAVWPGFNDLAEVEAWLN